MFGMNAGGYMGGNLALPRGPGFTTFEGTYRAYSLAFAGKESIGDKILMPASALASLTALMVQYPMLFKIWNKQDPSRYTHVGVMEFTAEEGRVYLPQYIMQNLGLQEGFPLALKNVSLPKATYAKFRPLSKDFLNINNPKVVLESRLRFNTCLTKGDIFTFQYGLGKKTYEIQVVEMKPADACLVVDVDMITDFDAPVGFEEPQRVAKPAPAEKDVVVIRDSDESPSASARAAGAGSPAPAATTSARYVPFAGSGFRLDGGAGTSSPLAASSSSANPTAAVSAFGGTVLSKKLVTGAASPSLAGRSPAQNGAGGGGVSSFDLSAAGGGTLSFRPADAASSGPAAPSIVGGQIVRPSSAGLSPGVRPQRTVNKFAAKKAALAFQGDAKTIRE